MKVTVLGSGSRGNSILVESGEEAVLVDAGFSARDLAARLELVGRDPASLLAIVVTHEHGDHTRGVGVFARKFGTPVHLTEATRQACARLFNGSEVLVPYRPGYPFTVGSFQVEPFITAHDAVDPVAVALMHLPTRLRLGVATDLGRPTAGVRHALSGCHFLVLEANHDERLLREGPYPWSVKGRIASSHGHLSNTDAARLAGELLHPELAGIVLAHLSAECNSPALAMEVVEGVLRKQGFAGLITVAQQHEPTPPFDIPLLLRNSGPAQLSLL